MPSLLLKVIFWTVQTDILKCFWNSFACVLKRTMEAWVWLLHAHIDRVKKVLYITFTSFLSYFNAIFTNVCKCSKNTTSFQMVSDLWPNRITDFLPHQSFYIKLYNFCQTETLIFIRFKLRDVIIITATVDLLNLMFCSLTKHYKFPVSTILGNTKSFFRAGGTFLGSLFLQRPAHLTLLSRLLCCLWFWSVRMERGPDDSAGASKWGSWMRPLMGLQAVMNQHMNASLFSLKFFS